MNQNTKEIAIDILKEVRAMVEPGDFLNEYICPNITLATRKLEPLYRPIGLSLKKWISDSIGLGDGYPVESWLGCQGISDDLLTTENMRLYRLRWIDEMIAQVEAGEASLKIEGETE